MSISRLVPAVVPSVTHSSPPVASGSLPLATNTARPPPSAAMPPATPLATPGPMSLSRVVPALVPSVIQNSLPWLLSDATNKVEPLPSAVNELA